MPCIYITDSIGLSAVFFIYGGISFVSVIFIISQVPETKRKTLEDIATNTSKPNNTLLTKWFANRRGGWSLFTNEVVFQPSSSFERYSYREPPSGNLDLPESPTSPSPNFSNEIILT